jgi:hypothetical protein
MTPVRSTLSLLGLLALTMAGCQSPKDYTEYRRHYPKSILVLPPLNNSTEIVGGYSVLSATTRPIAEMGYYVFPVVVVDQFMKANGLPGPGEMHEAPLDKLREIFGADAVLYLTVERYGTKYQILASATTVRIKARLVDARTGVCLWENLSESQANETGLVEAVVSQVLSKFSDKAHDVAVTSSNQLVRGPGGLLHGPRHRDYAKDSQVK